MGPSCALLGVALPDISGLDLQARLARDRAGLPVLFMRRQPDVQLTVRAMKAGVLEFLLKPLDEAALLQAVTEALSRSRAAIIERKVRDELRRRYSSITPRGRQVIELVVAGRLNKQIAFELGLSEITVKAHRGRVMNRMQAGSLAELVKMSGKLGADCPARS